MKKLSKFIVKYSKWFFIIFIVLTIASALCIPTVIKNVNSDLTAYLPEGVLTSDGQKFLTENFNIQADVMVGLQGATPRQISEYVGEIGRLTEKNGKIVVDDSEEPLPDDKKAVAQCLWKNSIYFSGLGLMNSAVGEYPEDSPYNKAYIDNILYSDNGTPDDDTDDVYVLMITLNYVPSSDGAFDTLDAIESIVTRDGATCNLSGSTQLAKSVFESTIDEVWKYSAVGIAIVLIILFLFTQSWVDPLILLLTLGVSIILNLGTNIILKSTSIITFSASAILQLALAMDYAVFFLHAYRDEKKHTLDSKEAVTNAIPRTFTSVFASALTTIGGFMALFFMRFSIGMDMGLVLAKGIFMSLITVIFFQPAMVLLLHKQMDKSHKFVNLKLKKPIKGVIKYRSVVVVCLLIAILPAVLVQNGLTYNYFDIVKEEPKEGILYDKVDTLANQIVVSVPIDMDSEESLDLHYSYIETLRGIKNPDGTDAVSFMLGLNALVPREAFDSSYADMIKSQSGQYVNNGYGMYTVGLTNTDIESDEMFETIAEIERITQEYFPGQTYYLTGMAQASRDFAAITPTDFTRVSVASVLIIFLILLFTFKSFKHSIVLVLIIQFGIWINLSIQRITGAEINFMSYIIISSIQMGATVDYAILITAKYRDYRKRLLPSHAAYQATTTSVMSVATSATILAAACLSVYLMATNLIVAEITMLIARGAIISLLLVLFVLPSVLAFLDRPLKGKAWPVPPQDVLRKFRKRKADKAAENAPPAYPYSELSKQPLNELTE